MQEEGAKLRRLQSQQTTSSAQESPAGSPMVGVPRRLQISGAQSTPGSPVVGSPASRLVVPVPEASPRSVSPSQRERKSFGSRPQRYAPPRTDSSPSMQPAAAPGSAGSAPGDRTSPATLDRSATTARLSVRRSPRPHTRSHHTRTASQPLSLSLVGVNGNGPNNGGPGENSLGHSARGSLRRPQPPPVLVGTPGQPPTTQPNVATPLPVLPASAFPSVSASVANSPAVSTPSVAASASAVSLLFDNPALRRALSPVLDVSPEAITRTVSDPTGSAVALKHVSPKSAEYLVRGDSPLPADDKAAAAKLDAFVASAMPGSVQHY